MRETTWRAPLFRYLVTAFTALSLAACNNRSPIQETVSPTAPTTTIITPPAPTRTSALFGVDVNPKAVIGGGVVRGLVTFTFPAPPGGTVVTLSTDDPLVAVPSSIAVPAGAESAEFSATAQAVSNDRQVRIGATALGGSVSTALSLWVAVPPSPSFWFISEPGDSVGRGGARRFGEDSAITASCSASRLTVEVQNATDRWTAQFSAPLGEPLKVGSYENAVSPASNHANSSTTRPELGVTGNGATCTTTGRFVVHEVDLTTNGMVRGFRASFNQQCQGRPQILSGGVRVVNAPRHSAESVCYNQSPLPLPTSTQPTNLRFASTLGDFIGAGQTRVFEPPDTRLRARW